MIRKNAMGIMALACLATVLSAGLAAQTFATGGAGTIPLSGASTPYPSTINVSGLSGTVTGVTVTINGMTHTWTSDVDIVLVGPTGQNIVLMADCCGSGDLTGVNITFDDAAAGTIPTATTNLATGSYRPTNGGTADNGAPCPTPSALTTLASAFNGQNPNGAWDLYIWDDTGGDQGAWTSWSITFTGTTLGPEMDVTRGGAVADGGTDTVTGGAAGSISTLTYTITNSGGSTLNITTPVAAPGNLTNCTANITTQPSATVTSGGGTTTLVVEVTPAAAGAFSCTISIDNDDANENPYNWTISGTATGPMPEMDVARGMTNVADGSTDTLGNVLWGSARTVSYTINNSGAAGLNLTGMTTVVVTAGTNVTSATVTAAPATSIAASSSTTFTVTYTVTAAGAFDFTISIDNTDSDENPYNWTVDGTGITEPDMAVTRGAAVADGGGDSVTGTVAGTATTLTYTIANQGNSALTLTLPVTITGASNCTATVTTAPGATVAAAGSTTMVITVTPTNSGSWSFAVSVANDDPDENPYNWSVSGTAGAKPTKKDDGGCSTGNGQSWLMLAGLLAALGAALRSRKARA